MRIPSGTMLLPHVAGASPFASIIEIELPEWLLAVAYMAIGCAAPAIFDRQVRRCGHCRKSYCQFSR